MILLILRFLFSKDGANRYSCFFVVVVFFHCLPRHELCPDALPTTLTAVRLDEKYMCSNGDCIPKSSVCNLKLSRFIQEPNKFAVALGLLLPGVFHPQTTRVVMTTILHVPG